MNGKDSMADRVIHLLHPDMVENTTHIEDLGPDHGARTIDTEVNSTKDHTLSHCAHTRLWGMELSRSWLILALYICKFNIILGSINYYRLFAF